jgi:thiol-disulfide isomerase/thioredoxin
MLASHGPIAPELVLPDGYINTDGKPITLAQFRGNHVVLLDIWTYSCINCQRTLPYITAWYNKYKDQGLEVIGIHTPEFAFEKVQQNVEDAVKKLGINYPVILDNERQTWNAYGNNYWPRKYLINANGQIIYDHIGEGNYDETEREIQRALLELKTATGASTAVSTDITNPKNNSPVDMSGVQSPETYFGSARNGYLANGLQGVAGDQVLNLSSNQLLASDPSTPSQYSGISANALYLSGTWNFADEYATSKTPAKIVYRYTAKNVYMVASSNSPLKISIFVDGVKTKDVIIQQNTLYNIVEGTDYSQHVLEIDADSPGLNAFTFTFG